MIRFLSIYSTILLTLLIAACSTGPQPAPEGTPVVQTVVVTVEGDPVVEVVTSTPVPQPVPERSLVICLGAEPASLYPYASNDAVAHTILQAVYDGPMDQRGYALDPVILEAVPGLETGGAEIQTVHVAPGDSVVNQDGNLAPLAAGTVVRPSGCASGDCALAYDGTSPLEMDQMVVTFRLLPGLTWSDGQPLTAADSVFSFELASSTNASRFKAERTASYQAADELTVVWTGVPGFLDPQFAQNFWTPYPSHAWSAIPPAELPVAEASARLPLGYGPYTVEEWVPEQFIRLRRNANYFRAAEGLPKFENLVFRFVGLDPNANLAQLLSGECDLLDRTTNLDNHAGLLRELQGQSQAAFYAGAGQDWEHTAFGIVPAGYDDSFNPILDRPDLFGDVRTRQAIAMCMDRQRVVDEVLFGLSSVAHTYVPEGHPLYNPDIATYPYDPEAASALLQEVGWIDHDADPLTPRQAQGVLNVPNGTPLAVTYLTTGAELRESVAKILVASMGACGIEAGLELVETGTLYNSGPDGPLFGRNFELGQFAWQIGLEPPCHLYLGSAIPGDPALENEEGQRRFVLGWGGWNLTGYSNPAYDAACAQTRSSLPGTPEHRQAHFLAQEIVATDLPVVPLYFHLSLAASRLDFCGFTMETTAIGDLWNIERFDYGPGCEG